MQMDDFTTTRLVDEVSCCCRLQPAERRHRADESLSTFRSFAENQGSKEATWCGFLPLQTCLPTPFVDKLMVLVQGWHTFGW
jgi:hypothetical protein